MKESKTVLVTGGAGFIGSHITEACVNRGFHARVVDDLSTGRMENIAHLMDRIEFIRGDICDRKLMRDAVAGVDYLFHEAAVASVAKSVANPQRTLEANVMGTLNLLESARDAGVKRVVFASSSSVYGERGKFPQEETDNPDPISPYATSKLTGEFILKNFHSLFNLETVSLRYYNVFGARQDPEAEYAAVIPKFITMMKNGERPKIFGDGLQSRDFCHIDNIVQANLLAAAAPETAGGVFNVAVGETHDLLELVAALNEILGTDLKPEFMPPRAGDVKKSCASIESAKKILGYKPSMSFFDGLKKTAEFYLNP
ncbi:MAG: SDR family oxidoreductase [Deltaproteobacteria bacterium]|nr:SDR family oxidoreductase [Deltaproteobacteria bacterium]